MLSAGKFILMSEGSADCAQEKSFWHRFKTKPAVLFALRYLSPPEARKGLNPDKMATQKGRKKHSVRETFNVFKRDWGRTKKANLWNGCFFSQTHPF